MFTESLIRDLIEQGLTLIPMVSREVDDSGNRLICQIKVTQDPDNHMVVANCLKTNKFSEIVSKQTFIVSIKEEKEENL